MEKTDITPVDQNTDLVDRVRSILAGNPIEPIQVKAKAEMKIDGRTKAFKNAIKRIQNRKIKPKEKELE